MLRRNLQPVLIFNVGHTFDSYSVLCAGFLEPNLILYYSYTIIKDKQILLLLVNFLTKRSYHLGQ